MAKKQTSAQITDEIMKRLTHDICKSGGGFNTLSPYYKRVPYQYTSAEVYDEDFRKMHCSD